MKINNENIKGGEGYGKKDSGSSHGIGSVCFIFYLYTVCEGGRDESGTD